MLWLSFILCGLLVVTSSCFYQVWVLEMNLMFFSFKMFNMVFVWDLYTFLFSGTVLFISSMIFLFSFYYMDSESSWLGFSILLTSFVISMLFLILSPNLVMLLLGWDGLGLTSYLLVVFYSSSSSSVAGMLTFLTNRFGDILFLLSIGFLSFYHDWEVSSMKSTFFLATCMVMAFMTKSAQVPFSSWLPAAMAAPTPVSSLVHSSTLVTAGVFLLIRFNSLVMVFSFFLFFFSLFTLLLAGVMANYEWDLKKIIAYSTLSQLGFMVSTFSMGMVLLSFFHLITHAMFKASLFMSAGVMIHSADNSQEFRNSLNSALVKPFVSMVVIICLLCLSGIPLTSGFFSKDFILDGSLIFFFFFFLYMMGVFLTILYSFRFFIFSFKVVISLKSGFFMLYEKVFFLLFSIGLLSLSALTTGFFLFELIFSNMFFLSLSSGWKMFYLGLLFFLFFSSYAVMGTTSLDGMKKYFASNMWFLNKLITAKLAKIFLKSGLFTLSSADSGLLEVVGPQGIYNLAINLGGFFFRFQSFLFFSFFLFFFYLFLMF